MDVAELLSTEHLLAICHACHPHLPNPPPAVEAAATTLALMGAHTSVVGPPAVPTAPCTVWLAPSITFTHSM